MEEHQGGAAARVEVAPIDLVARFLQEAVYASRELTHRTPLGAAQGMCGLGERPEVPSCWSPAQSQAARALATTLGQRSLSPAVVAALDEAGGRWVRIQDGLDRKRNHFLKAFRMQHGADRRAYRPEVDQELAAGLDEINGENRQRLSLAAAHLLAHLREALLVEGGAGASPSAT